MVTVEEVTGKDDDDKDKEVANVVLMLVRPTTAALGAARQVFDVSEETKPKGWE